MMAMSVIVDPPPRPGVGAETAATASAAAAAPAAAPLFPCGSSLPSSQSPSLSSPSLSSTASSPLLPPVDALCCAGRGRPVGGGSRAPRCGRHGNWTPEEDEMLLRLVKRYNTARTKRWTYVAKVLGTGRIGK